MEQNGLLERLTQILRTKGGDAIAPCIVDLVVNGLQLDRFAPSDQVPTRQDVTQYLAAWCRVANLSMNECQTWLSDYAIARLSIISRSSESRIRHSTISNVKYIYRSGVPFVCGREGNRFKAECSDTCRWDRAIETKVLIAEPEVLTVTNDSPIPNPLPVQVVSVKDAHREEFMLALQLVRSELAKGTKKIRILRLLKNQGMKTRTGREWTSGILVAEINRLKATKTLEMQEDQLSRSELIDE